MHVHYSMERMPEIPSPVVTMGSFDGVHAGHRVIISRLNQLAKLAGGQSVLVTFHPHPRKVLYPEGAGKDLKLISTLEEKCRLLEDAGLAHLVIQEFTPDFSKTTSATFVEEYLVGKLHAHTIVVGFNHYFGHNKEGSFKSLFQAKEQYGFQVEEIPEQEIQNESVSSTKIRKALNEGHIQRANAYLEHHFLMQVDMEICQQGSKQTGNQCYNVLVGDPNKLVPPFGSYAVSYHKGRAVGKGLLKIAANGILLFPLWGEEKPVTGTGKIYFHKHLIFQGFTRIASEMEAVQELIY